MNILLSICRETRLRGNSGEIPVAAKMKARSRTTKPVTMVINDKNNRFILVNVQFTILRDAPGRPRMSILFDVEQWLGSRLGVYFSMILS
jgi:hypothetical protein